MLPAPINATFWCDDAVHIATNPHRPQDAEGLAEFARRSGITKNLLYFQTSGSEGVPKWVGLSRRAFLASARAVNVHLEATEKDRWLIALPLHHVGGFSILARCFASGASLVQMEEKWDAVEFTRFCEREQVTLTSLVPTQVFDLVRASLSAPTSLRAVVVGGAGLSKETGLQAQSLGWRVLQSYGMTETASQIATEPLDHLERGFDPDQLEVLSGWELRCDDAGRLIVRGAALASGYMLNRDGAWQWQPLDNVGGLITRDHVRLWSEQGRDFLSFQGRDAEMVKVLGELVNTAALRERLREVAADLPNPDSLVIWPRRDERKGCRLTLVGDLSHARLEEVRVRFNASVSGPERLDASQSVAFIPHTPLGKIDHAALRHLLDQA